MSLHRDIGSGLRAVRVAPGDNAAGTVSSTAFKFDGGASGELFAFNGAASGTPDSYSVTYKLMVADDDGAGAPGAFTLYTGPDGVAAQVAITADSQLGSVAVKLEGSGMKMWGRVDQVTAFVGGTTPKVESAALFVFNDRENPARAVVYAA